MTTQRLALTLSLLNLAILTGAAMRTQPAHPAGDEVLRGRGLELTDERGKARASIRVEEDGQVVLRLLDQQGTIRVKLGAGKDGSGLVLLNDATEPGVHLLAKSEGSSMRLATKDGHERVIVP
jgi:hypothetical protein